MKTHFALVFLLVFSLSFSFAQSAGDSNSANTSNRDKLIGAWRLLWVEEQGKDGKPIRSEPRGIIMYARDGHMSAQIEAPKQDPAMKNPVNYEKGGYEAYFGTFEVDEEAHTVTHHVLGALVPTLIGKDLTRIYRFDGKQLVMKSARADEHWTIAWEHY